MNEPMLTQLWFARKRYGWGWGLPLCWQGWAVYLSYAALLALLTQVLPPLLHPVGFATGVAALTWLLIAVCWLKGERPRWQWGEQR